MYPGLYDPSKGMQSLDSSAGLPDEFKDSDVPAYMRAESRRKSTVGGLVGAVQGQLREGKETYTRGRDGVLVSDTQLKELRGSGVTIRVGESISNLVTMPSSEDVSRIFKDAYQTISDQMPPEYQEEARKRLGEIEPKFAGTLEEAAAAFGQTLPTQPQG